MYFHNDTKVAEAIGLYSQRNCKPIIQFSSIPYIFEIRLEEMPVKLINANLFGVNPLNAFSQAKG